MSYLRLVTRIGKILANLSGNHYRPVLPAGTAKRYRQVALTLANIVGQEIDQQSRDSLHELHRLGKGPDIFSHTRIPPGKVLKTGNIVRIRQKPDIEDQVAI